MIASAKSLFTMGVLMLAILSPNSPKTGLAAAGLGAAVVVGRSKVPAERCVHRANPSRPAAPGTDSADQPSSDQLGGT